THSYNVSRRPRLLDHHGAAQRRYRHHGFPGCCRSCPVRCAGGRSLFLGIGLCQVTLLTLCFGTASGVQYYFFAAATSAIYLFHGFHRAWLLTSILPMLLFVVLTTAVGEQGLVVSIPPTAAHWLSTGHAIGSFVIFAVIGFLFSHVTDEAERLLSAEKGPFR